MKRIRAQSSHQSRTQGKYRRAVSWRLVERRDNVFRRALEETPSTMLTKTTTDVTAELTGSDGMKLTVREHETQVELHDGCIWSRQRPSQEKAINQQTTRNYYRSCVTHSSKTNNSLPVQTRKQWPSSVLQLRRNVIPFARSAQTVNGWSIVEWKEEQIK
jgi:hypothetical protein